MSEERDQFRSKAEGWSEHEYADGAAYLDHRAEVLVTLGPRLVAGDEVLDLACGDGGLGHFLLRRGLRYRGVDVTPEMTVEARRRLGATAVVEEGDLDAYAPPAPVAATTVFRAIYYASDMGAFFRRAGGFTTKKLVFDLNPRQYAVDDVVSRLRDAGFDEFALRPFFAPQRVALPALLARALRALERAGPLARLLLRFRFTYVVAAWRSSADSESEAA